MSSIQSQQPCTSTQMAAANTVSEPKAYNTRPPRADFTMLLRCLTRSAYSEKALDALIDMFPRGATSAEGTNFTAVLPLLSVRDEALQKIILATGIAVVAKSTSDEALSRQSRALYGTALSETAVALCDPFRAKSEAMLLVPPVMALFEILFGAEASSPTQAKSWLSHAAGELALIISRDPEAYSKNDTAHSLFVNARSRLVVSAVRTRKETILNTEEWKTLPWRNRIKTANDLLVDILCGVSELVGAMETLDSRTLSTVSAESLCLRIATKTWILHVELQDWFVANSARIYTPTVTDAIVPISFPSFGGACLTIRYWLVGLLVYSHIDKANGVSPDHDLSTTHPNRPHPRMYARFIARSVSYFLQAAHGIAGVITVAFPLGVTLDYMEKNPSADAKYMGMIEDAMNEQLLPSAIRDFLVSVKNVQPPALAMKPSNRP